MYDVFRQWQVLCHNFALWFFSHAEQKGSYCQSQKNDLQMTSEEGVSGEDCRRWRYLGMCVLFFLFLGKLKQRDNLIFCVQPTNIYFFKLNLWCIGLTYILSLFFFSLFDFFSRSTRILVAF